MLNRMAGHLLAVLMASRNADAALVRAGKKPKEPTLFIGYRHSVPSSIRGAGGVRKHHKKSRSKAGWRGALGRRVA